MMMMMKVIVTLRPRVLLTVVWNRNTEFTDFELAVIVRGRPKKSKTSRNYYLDTITVLDLNKRQQFNGVDSFQIPTFREHTYIFFGNDCFRSLDCSLDDSWEAHARCFLLHLEIDGERNIFTTAASRQKDKVDAWPYVLLQPLTY